jgi:hypothetical protein
MNIKGFDSMLQYDEQIDTNFLFFDNYLFSIVLMNYSPLQGNLLNVYCNSNNDSILLSQNLIQGSIVDINLPFKTKNFKANNHDSYNISFECGELQAYSDEFKFKF